MGIDPGFRPSSLGICILQHTGAKIQVLFAEDYPEKSSKESLDKIWELMQNYAPINKIIVDASRPDMIKALKIQIGEDPNYAEVIKRMKAQHMNHERLMKVLPLSFGINQGREMLAHTKYVVENHDILIHPSFDKLISALRTAQTKVDGGLDKPNTNYNDILDALRLALHYFPMSKERKP